MQRKETTRLGEIVAVILTGLGKFLFMDYLNYKLPFIVFACIAWTAYVIYKHKKNKEILAHWGLTFKNFKSTFYELLPYFFLIVLVFITAGSFLGLSVLNYKILAVLLIYPLWGIVQQFIIIGVLAGNLKAQQKVNLPNAIIILITALIFGVVHFPFPILVIGTFCLALVYTYLFLNKRNLIVLGIFHGWLGAFFYYCILGRDAFSEVFLQMGR